MTNEAAMDAALRPTPHELWKQANGDQPTYQALLLGYGWTLPKEDAAALREEGRVQERARLVRGILARAEDYRVHAKAIWASIRDVADMIEGGMGQFAEESPQPDASQGSAPVDRDVKPENVSQGAASRMEALFRAARKPRTTVSRFASQLKERITKVENAFSRPGQQQFVAGAAYIKGVVDALLSDYDARDPEDFERLARGRLPAPRQPPVPAIPQSGDEKEGT